MDQTRITRLSRFLRTAGFKISAPLGALASISTIVIMLVVSLDVASRNFSGQSIPGLLEMSESALVATVFLGIAYTGATNGHVAVDLVTDKLSINVARKLSGVVWLLSSVMVMWLIYASLQRAIASTAMNEVNRGLMEWPIWPSRWLLVIGYAAFMVVALINTYLSFRNEPLLGEEEDALAVGSEDVPVPPEKTGSTIAKSDHTGQGKVQA